MPEVYKVDAKRLTAFSAEILQKVGLTRENADIAANLIVKADLRGVDTHGVAHLGPFYVTRIQNGHINLNPNIEVSSSVDAAATIDGDNGFGFTVGHTAMEEAIKRAEKVGAGFVAVRNSTHFGAASVYSSMALSHDMIGICLSSTAPLVFPPGSKARGMGTNPISIAVPAGKESPFILDMSTSTVPGGKIGAALRMGKPIPDGWAVDKDGKPTVNPLDVFKGGGGLVPLGSSPQMGSYKGFGLGIAVEIFSSILSGAVASLLMEVNPGAPGNYCDHFFGALKIGGFLPVDTFKLKMDEMKQAYQNLPKADGVDAMYLAGDIEMNTERERLENGIPLDEKLFQSLEELSKELDVPFNLKD